jgi:hypothetical protein
MEQLCYVAIARGTWHDSFRFVLNAAAIVPRENSGRAMLGMIIFVLLISLLAASMPWYPYSRRWGYVPSRVVGVMVIGTAWLMFVGHL